MDEEYEVKVSKQIEDLVPGFLENRRQDVDALRAAVALKDTERLRYLGHRLKGVGASYGFEWISAVGKQIEEFAYDGDEAALARLIEDFGNYLSRLRVTYE